MRTHGLVSTYVHGCRCLECREASRQQHRVLRARRHPVVAQGVRTQQCIFCWRYFAPRGLAGHERACAS